MLKLLLTIIISFYMTNVFALGENILIKQGKIQITLADLDGFAYSMPEKVKEGFFDSAERLDSTLKTMLTMKHVVNYGEKNNLLDKNTINNQVSKYFLQNSENILQLDLNDIEFIKLKKYIILKASYINMQKYIRNSVVEDDLIELAKEKYTVTKQQYYQIHSRDINYVNVKYNESNKQQQLKLAEIVKQSLKENNLDFDKTSKKYESNEDVKFIKGIKEFHYNKKYKLFSDFVFSTEKQGLIDSIVDINNHFVIAVIIKISPQGYKEFSEVKNEILAKLKKNKVRRKFGDMVSKITTDPIETNEDGIMSLRTRYLPKTSQN